MRNLTRFDLFFIALSFISVVGCDNESQTSAKKFEKGVFVVNEGNFLDADGTISYINPVTSEVTQDLFGSVNQGLALGDVVQSMTLSGDLAYIVVNNSNKMEVVDALTFQHQYTISNLALPRNFTTFGGKGYVTEWVSFADPGRVSVIDLANHTVTSSITTDYGAEGIVALNDLLYVSNNFSNTISVINPATAEVVKTITVGNAPGTFVIDGRGMLWVICGGGYDMEYNLLDDGKLVQIDPLKSDDVAVNSVVRTIELGFNAPAKLAINQARNKIYYYSGSSVYVLGTSDTAAPDSPLLTEVASTGFYGIGIDPTNDILYLADTKGFAGNGTIYRYTNDGLSVDHVAAGRGPNGFVFK